MVPGTPILQLVEDGFPVLEVHCVPEACILKHPGKTIEPRGYLVCTVRVRTKAYEFSTQFSVAPEQLRVKYRIRALVPVSARIYLKAPAFDYQLFEYHVEQVGGRSISTSCLHKQHS